MMPNSVPLLETIVSPRPAFRFCGVASETLRLRASLAPIQHADDRLFLELCSPVATNRTPSKASTSPTSFLG